MDDSSENKQSKSKSQLKRDMLSLQELGGTLIKLSRQVLAQLPLNERLLQAILLAQKITSRSATRRQLQYIGRLMREDDVEPIKKALASLQFQDQQTIAEHHRLEKWRDQLILEGDSALKELLVDFPQADRQYLRQLIRKAQQEQEMKQAPRAARLLFRYLRNLQQGE